MNRGHLCNTPLALTWDSGAPRPPRPGMPGSAGLYSLLQCVVSFSTFHISPLMAGSDVQNQVPGCPLRPVCALTQPLW